MLTTKENIINRKIMLLRAGISQSEIARRLSNNAEGQRISRQAVNNEMRGGYESERIRLGICEITGIPRETFWPEFYGPDAVTNNGNGNTVSHDSGINDSAAIVN